MKFRIRVQIALLIGFSTVLLAADNLMAAQGLLPTPDGTATTRSTTEYQTAQQIVKIELPQHGTCLKIWQIVPQGKPGGDLTYPDFLYSPLFLPAGGKQNKFRYEPHDPDPKLDHYLKGKIVIFRDKFRPLIVEHLAKHFSKSKPKEGNPVILDESQVNLAPAELKNVVIYYLNDRLQKRTILNLPTLTNWDLKVHWLIPKEDWPEIRMRVDDGSLMLNMDYQVESALYNFDNITVKFNVKAKENFELALNGLPTDAKGLPVSRDQSIDLARKLVAGTEWTISSSRQPVSRSAFPGSGIDLIQSTLKEVQSKLWDNLSKPDTVNMDEAKRWGFSHSEFNPISVKRLTTKYSKESELIKDTDSFREDLKKTKDTVTSESEKFNEYEKSFKDHKDVAVSIAGEADIFDWISASTDNNVKGTFDREEAAKTKQQSKEKFFREMEQNLESKTKFRDYVSQKLRENWEGRNETVMFIPQKLKIRVITKEDCEATWEGRVLNVQLDSRLEGVPVSMQISNTFSDNWYQDPPSSAPLIGTSDGCGTTELKINEWKVQCENTEYATMCLKKDPTQKRCACRKDGKYYWGYGRLCDELPCIEVPCQN